MQGLHFGALSTLRWRFMPIEGGRAEQKFAPVILAGGSGTRFWPRSRKARAKQGLALDGERTMIQQTLERLLVGAGAVSGLNARRVRRFTEKPAKELAEQFLATGDYAWNSGIFLWSARTLAGAIREHSPA